MRQKESPAKSKKKKAPAAPAGGLLPSPSTPARTGTDLGKGTRSIGEMLQRTGKGMKRK